MLITSAPCIKTTFNDGLCLGKWDFRICRPMMVLLKIALLKIAPLKIAPPDPAPPKMVPPMTWRLACRMSISTDCANNYGASNNGSLGKALQRSCLQRQHIIRWCLGMWQLQVWLPMMVTNSQKASQDFVGFLLCTPLYASFQVAQVTWALMFFSLVA